MAFPHKPIIITEAPSFVHLPNPSKASGQIPAQTNELANPNNTTNQIEISAEWPKKLTCPLAKMMSNVSIVPNSVHSLNALTCFMNLGIQIMPMTYPHIVAKSV